MFAFFKRLIIALGDSSVNEAAKHVKDKLPQVDPSSVANSVVNYALYAVGLLAVVMIIVGGVQMTTSAGDPSAVAKARKTITYSVIGLLVAILAYAIVNFVVVKITQ